MLVEFVSAIIVGSLIGWQIDSWAHTGPDFSDRFPHAGASGRDAEHLSDRDRAEKAGTLRNS
ncbi:MAG: hypothetical protein WDN29_00950 [Methylovirgula sp.]